MKKHRLLSIYFWVIISTLLVSSSVFAETVPEKDWHVLYTVLHSKQPFTTHDRHILYQILHWPHPCEENFRTGTVEQQKRTGLTQYALGSEQVLLEISCGLAAYQSSFSYYFIDFNKKQFNPVLFETLDFDEKNQVIKGKTSELSGEAMFGKGKLTMFTKARGVGGCGTQITYGFKDGQSYILEARGRSCSTPINSVSKEFTNPDNWPLLHIS